MIDATRTYGPTTVEKWMKCSVLMDLERRWEPNSNNWTPNILVGKMVALGLATALRSPSTPTILELTGVLSSLMNEERSQLDAQDKYTEEGLMKLALKGVKLGLDYGIPFGGSIVAIEENIGGGRPDIVWRDAGGLRFIDWKTSLSLDPQYVSQRLSQYEASWQLMDYAWRIREHYQETPITGGAVLLALSPRAKAYPFEFPLDDEHIDAWLRDATEVWSHMEAQDRGTEARWHNWGACTTNPYAKDRKCPMFAGCHVALGDESKFKAWYQQRKGGHR